MSQNQQTPAQNAAEAFGCAIMAAAIVALIMILFFASIESAQKTATNWFEKSKTPQGYVTGKVANVKTWQEDDFKYKEGNLTLTLPIKDRCEVTFSDGRSKKFVGMPKDTVPTDKEVTFVWAGFDILLEVVDAEEFKKRPNKPGDPKPPEPKPEEKK